MVSNARRLETSQVRAVTGEDRQEKANSPETIFMASFLQLLHLCRGSIRVKGEKIEVNKMKNHDGSNTPTLIYAYSSNVLMGCA